MLFLSDVIVLIFTSLEVTYHIECDMAGLKYFLLETNISDSVTFPSIVFSLRVYDED